MVYASNVVSLTLVHVGLTLSHDKCLEEKVKSKEISNSLGRSTEWLEDKLMVAGRSKSLRGRG